MIGYAAAALTTTAFIPQVVKSWRSRSTGDLSALMLVAFTAGIVLWLLYGLALGSMPVILANGITLVLSATLAALKMSRPRGHESGFRNRDSGS
jgi:MtN3 and saliva related transmembrane protein